MPKKLRAVLVNLACIAGIVLAGALRPDTDYRVFLVSALAAILIVNLAVFRWAPRSKRKEAGENSNAAGLWVLALLLFAASLLIEWQLRRGK